MPSLPSMSTSSQKTRYVPTTHYFTVGLEAAIIPRKLKLEGRNIIRPPASKQGTSTVRHWGTTYSLNQILVGYAENQESRANLSFTHVNALVLFSTSTKIGAYSFYIGQQAYK